MNKEPVISREEYVACALIDYINAEPPHYCGLCFYLDVPELACDAGASTEPIDEQAYNMVEVARNRLGKYGNGTYITEDREEGPVPIRLEFAADLLEMLISGELYFSTVDHHWNLGRCLETA